MTKNAIQTATIPGHVETRRATSHPRITLIFTNFPHQGNLAFVYIREISGKKKCTENKFSPFRVIDRFFLVCNFAAEYF